MKDDTISRLAAINAIENLKGMARNRKTVSKESAIYALKELPPAQAEVRTQMSSADLISRQALMKEFSDFVRASNDSAFARTPTWNDAVSLVGSMPPAQPEPIRINLNEPIKVKLTDWGKEIYYHQYDRTNQIAGREICKPKFPKEDENGYTEFQLWCFIELYGIHMGMTLPNVVEPLEIVYER